MYLAAARLVVGVSDAYGDRTPFWSSPTRVLCSTPSREDDVQGVEQPGR